MKIKDLPERIKELALQRQQEQGNQPNEELSLCADKDCGGFTWNDTKEGHNLWFQISRGDF